MSGSAKRLLIGGRMTLRAATALLGGYALAAALASLLARLLPVDRVEATVWGLLSSALLYAVVALWCFHERRLARVVGIVWGGSVAVYLVLRGLGVRP